MNGHNSNKTKSKIKSGVRVLKNFPDRLFFLYSVILLRGVT